MLVFARKKNEWVDIGPEIEICVLEIRGNKVRLGINAPRNLQVHRREITLKIKEVEESQEPTMLFVEPADREAAMKILVSQQRSEPK